MDNVMKIRLRGTSEEVDMFLRALRNDPPQWLDVVDTSGFYANRREPGVRVYIVAHVIDPLSPTGEHVRTVEEG
jgi:hypothetical protein